MTSLVKHLTEQKKLHPPSFLPDNVLYETWMGSHAYGVADNNSDRDVYGFCMPPKDTIFPHLRGEIPGFGRQVKRFEQYQEQHIIGDDGREYDFSIYSIVRYFQLCMENNPNMLDSLFTPDNCVVHITRIGQHVRDNRKLFLSKKIYHTFRGYAHAQIAGMERRTAKAGRVELVEKYGYDVKFAYHVVRLMDEAVQILSTGDMDLQKSRDVLRAIRQGTWTQEQIKDYFASQEKHMEELYKSSPLRYNPDEQALKNLLLECLEDHYGDLSQAVTIEGRERLALETILELATKGLGYKG